MKEKKVGDRIIFDYDVYEIYNNVEIVYDHTDTLGGVVVDVIHDRCGRIVYKVRLISVINAESVKDYDSYLNNDTATLEADDDKVYRGSGLAAILYPQLRLPTKEQIEMIQSFGQKCSADYIRNNWYKKMLGNLYDEEEFGISKPAVAEGTAEINWDDFWKEFKKKVMPA